MPMETKYFNMGCEHLNHQAKCTPLGFFLSIKFYKNNLRKRRKKKNNEFGHLRDHW